MGSVSYSSPKSFEEMAEAEEVQEVVNVTTEVDGESTKTEIE